MGLNSIVKSEAWEEHQRELRRQSQARVKAENDAYDTYMHEANFRPRIEPKPIKAIFPQAVGSAALYYRTAWITQREYYALKHRYGTSVVVLADLREIK